MLSIKDEYTFRFSNFLIIGLCNSSANSWFDIISLLTPLREANLSAGEADFFFQKIYKPLKQVHVDIHHILEFQQY